MKNHSTFLPPPRYKYKGAMTVTARKGLGRWWRGEARVTQMFGVKCVDSIGKGSATCSFLECYRIQAQLLLCLKLFC